LAHIESIPEAQKDTGCYESDYESSGVNQRLV